MPSSSPPPRKKPPPPRNTSGTTSTTPEVDTPRPFPSGLPLPSNDFLRNETPYKTSYMAAMETAYEGFVVDPIIPGYEVTSPSSSSSSSSNNQKKQKQQRRSHIETTLHESMEDYFRTDVTQPFGLGTKCAKTYVTRCLVGDFGTSYKYLGLRMFAIPWSSLSSSSMPKKTVGASYNVPQSCRVIHNLSQKLSERTKEHLKQLDTVRRRRRGPPTKGRSTFSICLINRMDDAVSACNKLKDEPSFGVDKTSVAWHADSSLEHYSTIAVYQLLIPSESESATTTSNDDNTNTEQQNEWSVALRVAHHAEGPQASKRRGGMDMETSIVKETPAIACSLPSGSAYYLLDNFNHHHQHTVLFGNKRQSTNNDKKAPSSTGGDEGTTKSSSLSSPGIRYSCTFRLLRPGHTVLDMLEKCKSVIGNFHKKGAKVWRSEQLVLNEVESEWIRQFYVQGEDHYQTLWPFWKDPIEQLLRYWGQLESRTHQTIQLLRNASEARCGVGMEDSGGSTGSSRKKDGSQPTPTRAERKARDRRKKALATIEELLCRSDSSSSQESKSKIGQDRANPAFYTPFAKLLEERATMRELWLKREKDYVFHKMSPGCRPLPPPFNFCDDFGDGHGVTLKDGKANETSKSSQRQEKSVVGVSPLPGDPQRLMEISKHLQAWGAAFTSGKAEDLPKSEQKRQDSTKHAKDANSSKGTECGSSNNGIAGRTVINAGHESGGTLKIPIPKDPTHVYPLSVFPPDAAFNITVKYPAIVIPVRSTAKLRNELRYVLLHRPKMKTVYPLSEADIVPTNQGTSGDPPRASFRKLILVDKEDVYEDPKLKQLLESGECCKESHMVIVGYEDWTVEEVLRKLLPFDEKDIPSSFEIIGHLAHVNLRDELLPFKYLIGKVLLDKNSPRIKTVVNKVGSIETEYRTFGMEIVAGNSDPGWSKVTVKEEGCQYNLDFREVYWNSRLGGEHRRLVQLIGKEAKSTQHIDSPSAASPIVVADLMAGIGPFAVPLSSKKNVKVYANDLNPSSFKYLKVNASKNKCGENLQCYNMDARKFCHHLQDEGIEFHHVLMNLPATAPEFLDCFRGFKGACLPRIHVHCFGPKVAAHVSEQDIVTRCSNALGCTLRKDDHSVIVHTVRDVAPKKNMYCISFTLPNEARDLRRIDLTLENKATKTAASSSSSQKDNDQDDLWPGWEKHTFGLEMQKPWSSELLARRKTIETRTYNLPPALLNKRMLVMESPSGKAGVSAIGNIVDLTDSGNDPMKPIGWCTFKAVKVYSSRGQFEADESAHLVSRNSGYGWTEGETKVIYGWVVGESARFNGDVSKARFKSAVRRKRSIFELEHEGGMGQNESLKPPAKKRKDSNFNRRKKKRRY